MRKGSRKRELIWGLQYSHRNKQVILVHLKMPYTICIWTSNITGILRESVCLISLDPLSLAHCLHLCMMGQSLKVTASMSESMLSTAETNKQDQADREGFSSGLLLEVVKETKNKVRLQSSPLASGSPVSFSHRHLC